MEGGDVARKREEEWDREGRREGMWHGGRDVAWREGYGHGGRDVAGGKGCGVEDGAGMETGSEVHPRIRAEHDLYM
jgi:hypothetical protein